MFSWYNLYMSDILSRIFLYSERGKIWEKD